MGEESEAVLKGEITGSWMQSSGTHRGPIPEWQAGENVLQKMARSHVATSRGEKSPHHQASLMFYMVTAVPGWYPFPLEDDAAQLMCTLCVCSI